MARVTFWSGWSKFSKPIYYCQFSLYIKGIKIFYYFAIKTWNDFIFGLTNLLLLSFTVYNGMKMSYNFAIKTWNDFIFELINLLLLSFNVYYGMKISYYFAIKIWNDFTITIFWQQI